MHCFCLSYCVITSVFSLGSVVNVNQRQHLSYTAPVYASFLFLNKTSSKKRRTKLPLEYQLGSQQWALSSEWVSCFFKKDVQMWDRTDTGLTYNTLRGTAHKRQFRESLQILSRLISWSWNTCVINTQCNKPRFFGANDLGKKTQLDVELKRANMLSVSNWVIDVDGFWKLKGYQKEKSHMLVARQMQHNQIDFRLLL